jgi:hypothetical protein
MLVLSVLSVTMGAITDVMAGGPAVVLMGGGAASGAGVVAFVAGMGAGLGATVVVLVVVVSGAGGSAGAASGLVALPAPTSAACAQEHIACGSGIAGRARLDQHTLTQTGATSCLLAALTRRPVYFLLLLLLSSRLVTLISLLTARCFWLSCVIVLSNSVASSWFCSWSTLSVLQSDA